ncbi:ABC transporter ATP-binding protein [Chitinophaga nivalis]|uniref:ATP-binding cassette domain-containing protein n=1 Tax=Chitinophaga nivalis TaxID=2991709 RepID=A0ABT3IHS8_9BACT|nr:ATP-binding cassette domain-containing protein [Chitinophaga nivalis]MCW3466784.1 ATP-binding cassette domain-containing protein [Chitinophaga nivalis]MCW3483525.1 ATP-binding cassette domain-containing protein [Chitinophaga nivalis]
MIKLDHVSKYFNRQQKAAVQEISFEVAVGETLVLLGTSGCGKTTTLRMINRLITPDNGRILVNNQDIQQQSEEILRRNMGYVLQHTGLFPHYTVSENIGVVPRLLRWDKPRIQQRITTLMEKLRLPPGDYANAYPHQLSGGQQQRVGLARALAADPPILLMDEPFGALDPLTRISVRKEFSHLDELNSKTIILVTHDIEEAFELGHRICLMNEGSIQQLGTPADLLFHPANDFVKKFLDPQRLQLELKALYLQDLWPWLGPAGNNNNASALPATTTSWEALAAVSQQPATVHYQQEQKILTASILMEAVSAYKNQ